MSVLKLLVNSSAQIILDGSYALAILGIAMIRRGTGTERSHIAWVGRSTYLWLMMHPSSSGLLGVSLDWKPFSLSLLLHIKYDF